MSLTLFAPAKLNLYLEVLGRRADGYHELVTLMQPLSIGDEVSIELGGEGLAFTCDDASLVEDNLVTRAAKAWFQAAELEPRARLHLVKKTPVAAGLGGGSSDAAATLLGLNSLYKDRLSLPVLSELATGLGADVPFFLQKGACLCTGIGEKVEPLPGFPLLNYVLINPGIEVSTAWVYGQFSKLLIGQTSASNPDEDRDSAAAGSGPPGEPDLPWTNKTQKSKMIHPISRDGRWNGELRNDLENVTLEAHPQLEQAKEALKQHGAHGTLMSGSGPTVFGLFRSPDVAQTAARSLEREPGWWVRACQGHEG